MSYVVSKNSFDLTKESVEQNGFKVLSISSKLTFKCVCFCFAAACMLVKRLSKTQFFLPPLIAEISPNNALGNSRPTLTRDFWNQGLNNTVDIFNKFGQDPRVKLISPPVK